MTRSLLTTGRDTPLFLTGRRGSARVDLSRGEIRHISFAPVDVFRKLVLQLPHCRTHTEIYTNHLVHHLFCGTDQGWQIRIFMAQVDAWMAILIHPINPQKNHSSPVLKWDIKVDLNLDYIHKFKAQKHHQIEQEGQKLRITQSDHPELLACIQSDLPLQVSLLHSQTPLTSLTLHLTLTPNQPGVVFWGGGNRDQVQDQKLDRAIAEQELAQVIQAEENWLNQGAQLECPDPTLNRFFQLSRSWFHKSIRRLPFGEPYTQDLRHNQEIDVVSASPDYHGVFANDCIQSSLEGMVVAPDLEACFRQGLLALYRHSSQLGQIPESIELIHGDHCLYYAPLRIGQHPEWIISLASLVLLTGDRKLGEDLWPGVQLALSHFVDPWQVGLNVWDTAAYPEQPDTRGYQFGRVYAQAWWIYALQLAAEMAGYLGLESEQVNLKQWAEQARSALETYFGRGDGYGTWLSESGELHPHQDHEMIIPVALGLAPPERARRVIETVLSSKLWLDPFGPRRANPESGLAGGDWVWGFMRWNFIQALFQYDRADQAIHWARQWAQAELEGGLRAWEVFSHPTATGITGEGYVWTAARACRALGYGLFGLQLRQEGLQFDPKLPPQWSEMLLRNLSFRGKSIDVWVRRGTQPNQLNGQLWSDPVLRVSLLDPGRNQLLLFTE